MSDLFQLQGSMSTQPALGAPSGDWNLDTPINETLNLSEKNAGSTDLSVDSPVTLDMGGVSNGNVLWIKAIGGKVRVRITSSDGSQQAIAVDSVLALISQSVPFTAVDLTRVAGVLTTVKYFVGQI